MSQVTQLSAAIEARQTFQTIRPLVSRELSSPASSEVQCPAIDLGVLRTLKELNVTANYSVQTGTYRGQAVVVKKYFKAKEEVFAQDLRQMLDQT
ncbi:hypothetical protein FRC00_011495 [Tulasnella sp. 408]|nr:hypothetical protein FRC00_011495 [Tulasnella sp. 408]